MYSTFHIFVWELFSRPFFPVRTIFTNTGTGYPGTFENLIRVLECCDAHTLLMKCTHLSVNAYATRQRGRAHS
jgi:hypothetical protein